MTDPKGFPLNAWYAAAWDHEIGRALTPRRICDKDVVLYRQKRRFRPGVTRLSVIVPEKPEKAGLDPYNLLIDRTPDDNVKTVTLQK